MKNGLFETEITIKVTNDGEKNQIEMPIDKGTTFIEVMVAIEMSQQMIQKAMQDYIALGLTNSDKTQKELEELVGGISMDEIFEALK